MSQARRSNVIWDDGWSVVALAVVATPLLAFPLVAPGEHGATDFAAAGAVVTAAVEIFAALFLYVQWRLTGGRSGWLVLALVTIAIHSMGLASSIVARPRVADSHPTRLLVVHALMASILLTITVLSGRRRLRVDPLMAGTLLGGLVVVLRFVLVSYTSPSQVSPDAIRVLAGFAFLIDLAIVVSVFTLAGGPAWIRVRLAIAMTLLGVGHAAAYPVPHGAIESGITVVANVLGATALLTVALALLRAAWSDNRAALETLRRKLEEAEAGARVERAQMHELRATISGLAAASRLLHHGSSVSPTHRRKLEGMIDSEMGRLQRLLNDGATGPVAPVDIDATIEPIVLRHRARGYPIRWYPGGERAIARADQVAEVVNVLLENAIQHAGGAGASVETRRVDHVVEVVVSDTGPGVSGSVRSRIFEWGARGQDSRGQGIGLNVAQQLITDLGGYLRLIDSQAPGATFVLGLPAEEQS
jgi:signal transduction histidine kinase